MMKSPTFSVFRERPSTDGGDMHARDFALKSNSIKEPGVRGSRQPELHGSRNDDLAWTHSILANPERALANVVSFPKVSDVVECPGHPILNRSGACKLTPAASSPRALISGRSRKIVAVTLLHSGGRDRRYLAWGFLAIFYVHRSNVGGLGDQQCRLSKLSSTSTFVLAIQQNEH